MYYIFTNDDSFNILLFTIFSDVERAGAAICTNSVAEIKCGVPPRGRDLQKSPGGMSERRQWVGHMRGVPSDTAAAFERSGSWI